MAIHGGEGHPLGPGMQTRFWRGNGHHGHLNQTEAQKRPKHKRCGTSGRKLPRDIVSVEDMLHWAHHNLHQGV